MVRRYIYIIITLLTLAVLPAHAEGETGSLEALRALYSQKTGVKIEEVYSQTPSADGNYLLGEVSQEALQCALGEVNFLRALAGLQEVGLSQSLCELCQYGAVLLAAGQEISHAPQQPFDMNDEFYALGASAASQSNLARFNWMEKGILQEAILGFSRDEGARNERVLGHRRWLLYPYMGETGFGLANDEEGRSYVLMYVMDDSNRQAEYDMICWPCEGYFPVEYLTPDTPWSVSLNPDLYDLDKTQLSVSLVELVSGAQYLFDEQFVDPEQFFVLDSGRYGDGPAYVFLPDLSQYAEVANGYEQNQVWQVTLSGLVSAQGEALPDYTYEVRMASLYPVEPVMVEAEEEEITLHVGESHALCARVIPAWADDVSLSWSVEGEAVQVDESGLVTACAPGRAIVYARAVNGEQVAIQVTVTGE